MSFTIEADIIYLKAVSSTGKTVELPISVELFLDGQENIRHALIEMIREDLKLL